MRSFQTITARGLRAFLFFSIFIALSAVAGSNDAFMIHLPTFQYTPTKSSLTTYDLAMELNFQTSDHETLVQVLQVVRSKTENSQSNGDAEILRTPLTEFLTATQIGALIEENLNSSEMHKLEGLAATRMGLVNDQIWWDTVKKLRRNFLKSKEGAFLLSTVLLTGVYAAFSYFMHDYHQTSLGAGALVTSIISGLAFSQKYISRPLTLANQYYFRLGNQMTFEEMLSTGGPQELYLEYWKLLLRNPSRSKEPLVENTPTARQTRHQWLTSGPTQNNPSHTLLDPVSFALAKFELTGKPAALGSITTNLEFMTPDGSGLHHQCWYWVK